MNEPGVKAPPAAADGPGPGPVRVRVELQDRGYDVLVGPGVRRHLGDYVPPGARRATVVTQDGIGVEVDPGISYEVLTIPGGEAAKSLRTVGDICAFMARSGMHRGDLVVAVGGGVVTDVAGFAAASYHRGIAVVNVPTTLLGQVDAAIGGKTGVNLAEGKNLVGAFWQPRAVLCDTDALASLPEREWRSGHGEMAKYAFLGVEDLDKLDLCGQVARCAALKAEVVTADEREWGRRVILNYGHTLAHALEAAGLASEDANSPESQLRHGEAVGVGLVFAAEVAHLLGRIGPWRVARHREVVSGYGLAVTLPAGAEASRLISFMERDKKADGSITMVLDGPGGVEAVRGVRPDLVHEALSALGGAR